MTEHIILLHGLWMRGFALGLLHRRLMEAGFRVHRFDYMSVAATQQHILARLHTGMLDCAPGPVHLVGHSLGGLLALRACLESEDLPPGRIVCLGSPLKGSAAARAFAGWGRGGEVLLGHNRDLLEQGLEAWHGSREVGVIAGCTPIGLGAMLSHIEGQHDGTIAVEETLLPGLAGHCVVETSHTGLLLSAEVARLTTQFLREGRFDANGPGADERAS
ncbi:alpha/beta hydrolase [Dyella jejuensis]|uniref:Alpha/beta hydrolase n=1 Tax=Dyella jejuensis TaxID=1432009 RepID=A0ABW8JKR3_9GAMM